MADRSGTICVWSAGAERLFGYDAETAIGERLDMIVPQEYRERHWAGFNAAMSAGETLFQIDDYFSSRVPFFRIPDCRRHFAQSVTSVNYRRYFAVLHELTYDGQVILAKPGQDQYQFLIHEW